MIKYEQLTLYYFSEGETKALESYYPSSHFLNIKCQVLISNLYDSTELAVKQLKDSNLAL